MTTLESRNYVATVADIRLIAKADRGAQLTLTAGRGDYLKALLATTRDKLGFPVRLKGGKVVKLSDEDKAAHLKALEQVHEAFYAVVVEECSEGLPHGANRAKELNRRTNYARTSMSAVRKWVQAGHSLEPIAAARVTKASLAVTPRARPPSPGRLKRRAEDATKEAIARVMELAAVDKAAAIAEIDLLMGQLVGQLTELGVKSTSDPKVAAEQHRPLRAKGGSITFFPTATQVARQLENPS